MIPRSSDFSAPPYITLAHIFNAEKDWTLPPRRFSDYQLQYVVEGEALYEIENVTYHTRKGDLITHYPGEEHSIKRIPGTSYVCVSIHFNFGDAAYPYQGLLSSRHFLGNYQYDSISRLLTAIPGHYRKTSPAHLLIAQGMLLTLIGELALNVQHEHRAENKVMRTKKSLALVQKYLREHYTENITMSKLAEIAGYSGSYLIHQYKKYTQFTPFEHIRYLRVERAKELALQTNLSVSEIAHQVGYQDVHTFGRMFRKVTGTSLSQFCASLVLNRPIDQPDYIAGTGLRTGNT